MVPWVFHTANEANFDRDGHACSSFRECHADRSLHAGFRVYTKGAANSRAENHRQSQGAQPQLVPITNERESI